ncbi:MAG: glycosyltransferase family 39 protein [Actinomycetota bacterium]|nr:glycosyltransferase family 39 protein [Actinomycetota bacterium]
MPRPKVYVSEGRARRLARSALGILGKRKIVAPVALFLILVLSYCLIHLAFVSNRKNFSNIVDGDELGYLMVATSLASDHDISPLDNYLRYEYIEHGFYQNPILHPEYGGMHLIYGRGGRMVYSNTRLLPFLIYPGFALWGYFGAVLTIAIFIGLSALVTYLIARRFTRDWLAFFTTLIFFLTYPILAYSCRIYPESVAILLLPAAFYSLLRLKDTGKWGYALVAGVLAGLFFQLHIKFLPLVLPFFLLLFLVSEKKKRDISIFAAPIVLSGLIALLWTGFLFEGGIVHGLTRTVSSKDLGGAPFWGFFGLYLDHGLGLFAFAPLYLAFIPGVPIPHERQELKRWWCFIPVCILVHTLSMGWFGQWHGGASPTPRYLVPVLPLMVICSCLFFEKLRKWKVVPVLILLAGVQIVISVYALIYPLQTFGISWHKNKLLPIVFGKGFGNFMASLFPSFCPMRLWTGIFPLLIWIFILAIVAYFLREKSMGYFYLGLD